MRVRTSPRSGFGMIRFLRAQNLNHVSLRIQAYGICRYSNMEVVHLFGYLRLTRDPAGLVAEI